MKKKGMKKTFFVIASLVMGFTLYGYTPLQQMQPV